MTDATTSDVPATPKKSKMPLILGFVLMLLGAGGGYYGVSSGLFSGRESPASEGEVVQAENDFSDVAFIPMEPISISLPPASAYKHLRFRAELEVKRSRRSDVEAIMPRIIDVLNSYLRAVEAADLEQPASLTRLRAQMLRRAQIVAGPGQVNDLLIMEFVLN